MELNEIYQYRFQNITQERRIAVWQYISKWVMKQLDYPNKILEVGAGRCEFINGCPANEKWALDFDSVTQEYAEKDVNVLTGKLQDFDFGDMVFDAVFMSNFLEHLNSPNEVHDVLQKVFSLLREKGGKVGILGPNFKYAFRDYFDCADHILPLTHIGIGEHLAGTGFQDIRTIPKLLPFSFRSSLPTWPIFVKWYLLFPIIWKFIGKQFFIMGSKF